jgi:hypothetical protein
LTVCVASGKSEFEVQPWSSLEMDRNIDSSRENPTEAIKVKTVYVVIIACMETHAMLDGFSPFGCTASLASTLCTDKKNSANHRGTHRSVHGIPVLTTPSFPYKIRSHELLPLPLFGSRTPGPKLSCGIRTPLATQKGPRMLAGSRHLLRCDLAIVHGKADLVVST